MTIAHPSVSEYSHLSTPAELSAAFAQGELTRGELMARAIALLTTENVDEILAVFDGNGRQRFVQFACEYATTKGDPRVVLSGLAAPSESPEETLRALRIIAGVDEGGEPDLGVLVGARLRELRLEAELTGVEVARAASMQREIYSRLERGLHVPDISLVDRVAQALEVSLIDVLVALDPEWRAVMGWSPRAAYHPVLLQTAIRIRSAVRGRQKRWRRYGAGLEGAAAKARR